MRVNDAAKHGRCVAGSGRRNTHQFECFNGWVSILENSERANWRIRVIAEPEWIYVAFVGDPTCFNIKFDITQSSHYTQGPWLGHTDYRNRENLRRNIYNFAETNRVRNYEANKEAAP